MAKSTLRMRILCFIFVIAFSTGQLGTSYAQNPLPAEGGPETYDEAETDQPLTEAEKNTEREVKCNFIWMSPEGVHDYLGQELSKFKKEFNFRQRLLINYYASDIRDAVIQYCSDLADCTLGDVQAAIRDETARMFAKSSRKGGLAALSLLWGAGAGVVIMLGKYFHNPAISVLGAQEMGGVTNIIREPVDLLWKPKLKKFTYRLANGQISRSRSVNRGFVIQTGLNRGAYDDSEMDGRGSHMGFRNDVLNSVQAIQNRYLIAQGRYVSKVIYRMFRFVLPKMLKDPSIPKDQDVAREWASLFFLTRHYYYNIDVSNPQVRTLITPIIAPHTSEIIRLKNEIGKELDLMEREESKYVKPGQSEYNQVAAFREYGKMFYEWCERPKPELRKSRSVFDDPHQ